MPKELIPQNLKNESINEFLKIFALSTKAREMEMKTMQAAIAEALS